jgi:eukaryotic-like serine/threonine-protein kinase
MTTDSLGDETIDAAESTVFGSGPRHRRQHEGIPRGTTLGRYLVLERLGQGGMGVVYAAYDPRLDRKVALKLVAPSSTRRSVQDAQARLLREAQSMARLTHPNVVIVHDVGVVEDTAPIAAGSVFMAMEHVDGVTLRRWLREQPRAWREVLRVLVAAGRGLAAAHAKGLVHRDFKPDNVMVDRSDRVLVMDFGLALFDTNDSEACRTTTTGGDEPEPARTSNDATVGGRLVGTLAYMSPEQHLQKTADARSDQFSFCVTAYEALFDQHPFQGESVAALSVAMMGAQVRPEPKGSPVPAWVRRHVRRGLARRPEDRFPTIDALLAALEADPRRRRRVALAGGLGLSAIAGVITAQQLRATWAEQACGRAGHAIHAVWSDEARTRVRDRLLQTGQPYAETTADSVSSRLDALAERWSEQRTELCRAAELRHELAPEVARDAAACLDEITAGTEQVVATLGRSGESIGRAVELVLRLPGPEGCMDEAGLARRLRPPAALEASVRELQRELAAVSMRRFAGDFVGAQERLEELRRDAGAIGWAPAIAEVEMARGTGLDMLGKPEQAVPVLEAAFFLAGAHGYDLVALDAATQLARTVGHRLARLDEGLRWGQHAQMLLERLGLSGTHHEARLLHHLASLHNLRGTHDQAIALMLRAGEIITEEYGEHHPLLMSPLNNLGITYGMLGRLAEAAEVFARAEQLAREGYGADHPERAAVLNNLGSVHLLRNDRAAARAVLQDAHRIYVRLYGAGNPDVAMTEVQLADIMAVDGDHRGALALLEAASGSFVAAFGEDHEHHAASRLRMANLLRDLGELPRAEQEAQRALAISTRVFGPTHAETSRAQAALARIVAKRGDVTTATASLEQAQAALAKTDGGTRQPLYGLITLWRAELMLAAGDVEGARALGAEALAQLEANEASPAEVAEARMLVARMALDPQSAQ